MKLKYIAGESVINNNTAKRFLRLTYILTEEWQIFISFSDTVIKSYIVEKGSRHYKAENILKSIEFRFEVFEGYCCLVVKKFRTFFLNYLCF